MAQTLAMPVAPSLALISNPRPLSRAVYFPVLNPPKVRGLSIECARVGGVKITNNKRIEFSLQYIHGISVLCDAEVALIVFSTTGKLFEYSSDPWDGLYHRVFIEKEQQEYEGWKCSSSCFSKSIFIEYRLNQNEEARTELRAVDAWILTDKPYSNQSIHSELLNFEKISKSDLSKVSSLIKKQTKRYQVLSEKIDDLCRRIQGSDPSEPPLSSEFRAQTQTEFLLEALSSSPEIHSINTSTVDSKELVGATLGYT